MILLLNGCRGLIIHPAVVVHHGPPASDLAHLITHSHRIILDPIVLVHNGKVVRTQFSDNSFITMTSAINIRQGIICISIISKLSTSIWLHECIVGA